ncbi:MAG: type II toxin-antitoxin system RelE/ParE family toxin [Emcibacter sp.]|nr:type II toxin-antitoxin system RelE/ParE family toxin [Emcibacter sp.]
MREYDYRIRPQAEADLDSHAYVIAGDNLEVALRLYDRAQETYEMLCDMPYMGVLHDSHKPELSAVRYMPIKDFLRYLVFYKITGRTIDIIRVLHSRMDRDSWLESGV